MPVWTWLSFGIMFGAAINQGITQKINRLNKKADPFFKNFWGGLVTFVVCLTALIASGRISLLWDFSLDTRKLLGLSAFIGLVVTAMWSFNLISYKLEASIAFKKLVVFGSYLIMAMFCGVVFFDEALTWNKMSGIGLYTVAFGLMDDKAWWLITGCSEPKLVEATVSETSASVS